MYLALYRKWRSRTFDDVIGQEHITTTLKNEVRLSKTAHSYLFTGPRGTGKTSCAKILAMAVNCTNSADGNPCLVCDSCKGIQNGSVLDVLEIDAASNNGVDDVRVLREEANYTPTHCQYRVYIIDETHMLTTQAFNALLKIMEEPPAHVKFILATTEAHKVPATILSRCQRFDFGRIKTGDIKKRLLWIASKESFTLDDDAAHLIARLADGGMRDALSILDQCTAFSDHVDTAIVSSASGVVLRDYLFELSGLIHEGKAQEVLGCVDRLYSKSKDLQRLVTELTAHYRNMMIAKTVQDCEELIHCLPDELEQLRRDAGQTTMSEILRILSALQVCSDQIARNYDKRLCVEMTLIKLCSPSEDSSVESLRRRVELLEERLRSGAVLSTPVSLSESSGLTQQAEIPKREEPAAFQEPAKDQEERTGGLPREAMPDPVPGLQVSEPAEPQVPASASSEDLPGKAEPETEKFPLTEELSALTIWPQILNAVKEQNPALAGVLSGSTAYVKGGDLFIDSPISLFGKMIKQEGFIRTLMAELYKQTGNQYRLRIKRAKKTEKKQASPFDSLLSDAAAMGIEIKESK